MSGRMQETNDPRYDGIYQRGGAAEVATQMASTAPLAPALARPAERPAEPSVIREVGPEAADQPAVDACELPGMWRGSCASLAGSVEHAVPLLLGASRRVVHSHTEIAVHGGAAGADDFSDVGRREPLGLQVSGAFDHGVGCGDFPPAGLPSVFGGRGHAYPGSLDEVVALELGEGGNDGEHGSARRPGCTGYLP